MSRWGAHPISPDRAVFSLWAPDCERVTLELSDGGETLMSAVGNGWLEAEAKATLGARYRFRISEDMAVPDPASRAQADGVHGWSVLIDPGAYRWRTERWRGRPWEEVVFYELHVGICGGFDGVARRLTALRDLGVTAVQLMPVGAFRGARNWGYDGVLLYAPAEAYGAPDDLKALVDHAHELGLMVFLDVVYNHFGPEGNYLGAYASGFFDASRQTPWGAAPAFGCEPVARFFIDNAIMWLTEYRFDGLRLDAVHMIDDAPFLDRLAREARAAVGPDRQVHLVLENEHNDAERLESGFDAQWNDDFHNTLHVLLTGETQSYYADFADRPAEKLARCLAEGFVYQGEPSPNHGGAPRGAPSAHLPASAFVNFLQNHDQVGNRAMGERLRTLTDDARLRAATALLLLAPPPPLLFMGEETGTETPFLFFTDFHDDLADLVREGRRREFANFSAFSDPEARSAIPDPNAPETFASSRPAEGADAGEWRGFYAELLTLRKRHLIPRLKGAHATGAEALTGRAVVARWTVGDGERLTLILNLEEKSIETPGAPPFFASGDPASGIGCAAWLESP